MNLDLLVNTKDIIGHIRPEIYGHFTEHLGRCVYGGIFVGENSEIPNVNGIRSDVAEAFRNIKAPVVRWPGGCFAEDYHWMDGIGPKDQRKQVVNTNWGGVTEDNSFGTHEFMEFCRQVGCKPYINANLGAGTVREMAEWIEYMTSDAESPMTKLRKKNGHEEPWKVPYLGVGNENWGCGGNMRPENYADLYRRYQSFCKNYSGNHLYRIACGPSGNDFNWMETIMKNLNPDLVNGIDLHYYTMPYWPEYNSATEFTEDNYYDYLNGANYVDALLKGHIEIMNRYDPDNRVGLVVGEWGCWHACEPGTNPGFLYQQNTMRDAIVAAIELNTFNRYSKRVSMANLAQAVNVLQSVILTEGDKMVKTPTYHVFDLFKNHHDGDAVYCYTENKNICDGKNTPVLSTSASVKDGKLTLTLANSSLTEELTISGAIHGLCVTKASARLLTGDVHDYNDFTNGDKVHIVPHAAEITDGCLKVTLPACSVCEVVVE